MVRLTCVPSALQATPAPKWRVSMRRTYGSSGLVLLATVGTWHSRLVPRRGLRDDVRWCAEQVSLSSPKQSACFAHRDLLAWLRRGWVSRRRAESTAARLAPGRCPQTSTVIWIESSTRFSAAREKRASVRCLVECRAPSGRPRRVAPSAPRWCTPLCSLVCACLPPADSGFSRGDTPSDPIHRHSRSHGFRYHDEFGDRIRAMLGLQPGPL